MINKKGGVVANTLAIILTMFMVFPVYWMVISSFKPRADFFLETPKFLPIPATLDNYSRVINDKDFFNFAKNSLIVTVVVVILSILVAFLAATAVARFNFKGRKAYIVMLLAVQMVPFEALLISMFVLLNAAGLVNQLTGVMIAYLAFVLPFTIWTLRGFIANVPKDLEEAAMIDGCSQGQAFRKILFPLIAPGLVSTSVFAFVMAWNEFILANVILPGPEQADPAGWLTSFQGGMKEIDWGGLMAGSVLFALPVIVFFVIVQGRIQSRRPRGWREGMTVHGRARISRGRGSRAAVVLAAGSDPESRALLTQPLGDSTVVQHRGRQRPLGRGRGRASSSWSRGTTPLIRELLGPAGDLRRPGRARGHRWRGPPGPGVPVVGHRPGAGHLRRHAPAATRSRCSGCSPVTGSRARTCRS